MEHAPAHRSSHSCTFPYRRMPEVFVQVCRLGGVFLRYLTSNVILERGDFRSGRGSRTCRSSECKVANRSGGIESDERHFSGLPLHRAPKASDAMVGSMELAERSRLTFPLGENRAMISESTFSSKQNELPRGRGKSSTVVAGGQSRGSEQARLDPANSWLFHA